MSGIREEDSNLEESQSSQENGSKKEKTRTNENMIKFKSNISNKKIIINSTQLKLIDVNPPLPVNEGEILVSNEDEKSDHITDSSKSSSESNNLEEIVPKLYKPRKQIMNNPIYNILKIVQDDKFDGEEEEKYEKDKINTEFRDLGLNLGLEIKNKCLEYEDENSIKLKKYKNKTSWGKLKYNMKHFLHSKYFSLLFGINITAALFLENIKKISFAIEYDYIVDIIMLSVFIFFICEIILHIIFIPTYRFSFFFYGDVLAMCGLISEVHLLQRVSHDETLKGSSSTDLLHIFLGNSSITKAIRLTSTGSRIGRIFSLLNVLGTLNIFQLGRLYKNNVDGFLEKSQIALRDKRKQENIRKMRRNNFSFVSNVEKMKFFSTITNIAESNGKSNEMNPMLAELILEKEKERELEKKRKTETQEEEINGVDPLIMTNFYKNTVKNDIIITNNNNNNYNNKNEFSNLMTPTVHFFNYNITNINLNLPNNDTINFLNMLNMNNNTSSVSSTTLNNDINQNLYNQSYTNLVINRKSVVDINLNNFNANLNNSCDSVIEEESYDENDKNNSDSNEKSNSLSEQKEKDKAVIDNMLDSNEALFKTNYQNIITDKQQAFTKSVSTVSQNLTHKQLAYKKLGSNVSLKKSEKQLTYDKQGSRLSQNISVCECIKSPGVKRTNSNKRKSLVNNIISAKKRFSLISKDFLSNFNCNNINNNNNNIKDSPKSQSRFSLNGAIPSLNDIYNNKPTKIRQSIFESNHNLNTNNQKVCDICGGIEKTKQVFEDNRRKSVAMNKFAYPMRKASISISELKGTSLSRLLISDDLTEANVGRRGSRLINPDEYFKKIPNTIKENENENENLMKNQSVILPIDTEINTYLTKENELEKSSLLSKQNKKIEFPYKLKILDELKSLNPKEYSRLGVGISKITTIRLVMLILVILFVLPYLDAEQYNDTSLINIFNYELKVFEAYLNLPNTTFFCQQINKMILNQTNMINQTPDLIAFGFIDRNIMCNFKHVCEEFKNETIFLDLVTYNKIRTADKVLINTTNMYMIYSINEVNNLDALLHIFKIIYVSILLFIGSFLFLKDSNNLVVLPLEETYQSIREIKFTQEDFFLDLNSDEIREKMKGIKNLNKKSTKDNEIVVIRNSYINMQKMLIQLFGLRAFDFFEKKIINAEVKDVENDEKINNNLLIDCSPPFFTVNSVILVVEISNLNLLIKQFGINVIKIISKIIEICDMTSFEYFGEIFKVEHDKIYIFWDQGKKYTKKLKLDNSNESEDSSEEKESFESSINISFNDSLSYIKGNRKDSGTIVPEIVKNFGAYAVIQDNSSNNSRHEGHINDSSESLSENNKNKIKELPQLRNKTTLQKNSANFALITAIKVFARCFNNLELKNLLSIKKTTFSLDLKLSLNKGNMYNFITNTSLRLESVYTGDSIKECLYINKLNTFKFNILYTENIYKDLENHLKKFSRNVSVILTGNKKIEKLKNIYAFDVDYNKPESKNPYITNNLIIDKQHGLVIRKTFIELMNLMIFEIDNIIKYDSEIIFSKLTDMAFLDYYKDGLECFQTNEISHAIALLKKALIFKPNDLLTKFLLEKMNFINIKKVDDIIRE